MRIDVQTIFIFLSHFLSKMANKLSFDLNEVPIDTNSIDINQNEVYFEEDQHTSIFTSCVHLNTERQVNFILIVLCNVII